MRGGFGERAQVSGPVIRERDRIVGWASVLLEKGMGDLSSGLGGPKCAAQTGWLPGVEEAEEQRQLGAPSEQSDGERACVRRDLSWEQDEALKERTKFHSEDA